MKSLTIVFVLAATPAFAACHKYSVWKYPWPQRCVIHVAQHETPPPAPLPPYKEIQAPPDIALPSLEGMEFPPDCDAEWCQRLKGIGLLRLKFGTD